MKQAALLVSPLLALSLLASCVDTDPSSPPVLVVEGYIEEGDYPVVALTTTLDPSDADADVADCLVRWGNVFISDGDTIVRLIGGSDSSFFPPYTYRSFDMKGEAGKTYTLTADYDGMKVTARTSIPQRVDIDSVEFINGEKDLVQPIVYLTSEADTMQYYRLFTRAKGKNTRPLPAFLGTFTNESRRGILSHPLNRPRTALDTADYLSSFRRGETIEVRLAAMTRTAYDFWIDYDNALAFGGSQFLATSVPLRSNVVGGYGYFFGYSVSRRILTIP